MAEGSPPPPSSGWRLGARLWLRTYRFPLSAVVLAVGVVLSFLAIAAFSPLGNAWPFSAIDYYTNQTARGGVNYNLAFAIVGPIILIIGAYLVGAYMVARNRFEQLMRTKSKAEFLRNLPEVEELLWDLTPGDHSRYLDKCAELRVRR
ncbi:MAG: hypothetical protein ACREB9_07995 [Thermoplasmata archaeon]